MCGSRKHNCQPFCGPEGRFHCSDSVCSLRPTQFSYLCMRVRILGVLKIVCCCRIKPDCRRTPAVVSIFTDSAACVLSFYDPSHHYNLIFSTHKILKSGGRILFLCVFPYPSHPRVTSVARERSWSFCQKCRWQVTAKHTCTLPMWL